MPQAEMTRIFSRSSARCTSTRGMGAPAVRNMRRVPISCSSTAGVSVRSERKGVEAMVKVTPSAAILRAARAASQMSWNTALQPSITGIIIP